MKPVHILCPRCSKGMGMFWVGKVKPAVHKACRLCKDEYLISLVGVEEKTPEGKIKHKIEATFELVLRRHPVTNAEREAALASGNRPAAV